MASAAAAVITAGRSARPRPRASRYILRRAGYGINPERGQADEESAVEIRPQREHRHRQPQGRAPPIALARQHRDQRREKNVVEELRPELHLLNQHDRHPGERGKLRRDRSGGLGKSRRQQGHDRARAQELEQLQPGDAESVVNERHNYFEKPFVIDPSVTRRRVGKDVRVYQMAGPEHYLAVADVAPQVGVGVLHRVRDDGEEQDEGGRVFADRARAGQRAAALAIDWRRGHGKTLGGAVRARSGTPASRVAGEPARANSAETGSR